jgi:hypothetical protein
MKLLYHTVNPLRLAPTFVFETYANISPQLNDNLDRLTSKQIKLLAEYLFIIQKQDNTMAEFLKKSKQTQLYKDKNINFIIQTHWKFRNIYHHLPSSNFFISQPPYGAACRRADHC